MRRMIFIRKQEIEFFVFVLNRSLRVCRAIHSEADLDLSCLRRLIYGSDDDTSTSFHFNLISQPEINR